MQLFDSHCHIHSADYPLDQKEVLAQAMRAGVKGQVVVGTDVDDSQQAISFAANWDNVWPSIALHPHNAKLGQKALDSLAELHTAEVIAIGECGLDYYYSYSSKKDQEKALRFQMDLALRHNKPMIFHIRDAFSDFWPIFDEYQGIKGVVHSFTAGLEEMDQVLSRGLLVGLNGIMTFTKNERQLEVAKSVPLESLLLETDSPFLTPSPYRGKVNEPKQILTIAEFLAELRGEDLAQLAKATTQNAKELYKLSGRSV